MHDSLSSPHRLARWALLLGATAWAGHHFGLVPAPADAAAWLAEQPGVGEAFSNPISARTDALVFMLGLLLFGPVVGIVAVYVLMFVHQVLKQSVMPLVGWLRLPEWTAGVVVVVTLGILVLSQWGVWLPRSLWFLGLVVRATRTALA